MADTKPPAQAEGVGRLGTVAAWISAVCCLPYLVLKVVSALGMPVGVTDRSLLHSSGWVAENAVMAVIQLAGLLLVLTLTRPWARRLPAWLLLFPAWVGTGLLFPVVVGTVVRLFSPPQASGGDVDGLQPWVFVMVYSGFTAQGIALAIAFACHVRAHWGRLLGDRTGQVLARRAARDRSWPDQHLRQIAQAVAALAAVPAVAYSYWAAGGSLGRSGTQPHPASALQAAGVMAAVITVIGLLGLAGRWGHRIRFWLPATLTWLGSGALAAFDGLNLTLELLFALFGVGGSELGWSLSGTIVAIKVVIGVSAAAVGALVVTTAAEDTREPVGR